MTRIEAEWLNLASTQAIFAMLDGAGFRAFAVGGCVRDSLLSVPVKDVDIATDAHPRRVMALAQKAGFRAVPTGIEHGTVTVVVCDVAYEVTTFRRDVETDGRRATVSFSHSVDEDARRRDFTMNALYADRMGQVYDPVGGLPDLRDRRVRFIEDAATRIREDYLRSLRFFRFHAWYGDPNKGFDAEAMAAISANTDGLKQLSRERIGAEVMKLLAAPDPAQAVAGMRSTGVLAAILPGADDTALGPLVHLESQCGLAPGPLRRLVALGGQRVRAGLRLSRKEAARIEAIQKAMDLSAGEGGYRYGVTNARDALLVRAASTGQPVDTRAWEAAAFGASQVFPVRAADFLPDITGPELGQALRELEQAWIESGFSLGRHELLEMSGREG